MKITPLKIPRNEDEDIRYDMPEDTRRYRKMINEYLQDLAKEFKQPLKLGVLGICAFQFTRFTIVIEVPKHGGCLFVYTVLHQSDMNDIDEWTPLMRTALELNYLQQETCGACISLDKEAEPGTLEFTLSFSHPLQGMDCGEFLNIIVNFMATTKAVHTKLMNNGVDPDAIEEEEYR